LKQVFVTPAQAGVPNAAAALGWHTGSREVHDWIPAYAGMTTWKGSVRTRRFEAKLH
jgi:hypothetical protein